MIDKTLILDLKTLLHIKLDLQIQDTHCEISDVKCDGYYQHRLSGDTFSVERLDEDLCTGILLRLFVIWGRFYVNSVSHGTLPSSEFSGSVTLISYILFVSEVTSRINKPFFWGDTSSFSCRSTLSSSALNNMNSRFFLNIAVLQSLL